jgi:hypothetical protein
MPSLEIKEPVLTIDRLHGDIVFDAQRLQDLLIDTSIPSIGKKAIQKINKDKKNHNTIVDEYEYKEDDIGRVYSKLQQLPKEYRNYLLGDDCIEIDFQNCHYQLIYQIGKKYNVNVDNIDYYIKNREECLKNIDEYRNTAKQMYLIAQYGGNIKGIDNKNINGVVEEIKTILVIMHADENLKNIKKYAEKQYKKKNNPYKSLDHSFLSFVLQTIENRNVIALYDYLKQNEVEIKLINHDGIIIKKNDFDNEKFKGDMEKHIFDETDFSSVIGFKKCEQIYVKPDYESEKEKEKKKNLKAFLEMKEVWENELGLCKITGLSCFSMFGLEGKPRNYFSQSQLEVSYADKKYDYYENGVKRRYSFIKEWIFYEDKKIYDAIDSFPIKDECPDNILNVWVDFPVVSYLEKMGGDFVYDEDAVKTYRQHIYLMAGEEQESCDFLEKWIGNFFQYPASKSLCPVIIGEQGTGKDLLVDIISAIIGNDRRLTTSKPEDDVWGKFNEIMENKILVHLSEVNSFQTSAGMNTLKDYITNPNFVIKRKGLKSSTIKSHHKYIALSNNAMPIKCGEGQRRFVNLLSSSKMKGNNEYFDKLVEIMGDMNKLASIYKYFMGLQNIPVRLTEKDIVKSEFHQEMESIVVDEVKEFIMDYINENKNEVCDKVRIADLYPQYKTFCEKKYYNNVKSLMSFSAKFGILMRSQLFSKITKNNKDRIGFSFNIPTREMALDFGYFGEVGGSN